MARSFSKITHIFLFLAFVAFSSVNFYQYISSPVGNTITFEEDSRLLDFTICPKFYRPQVPNITINSGHNVSDIYELLPSMKTAIQYIIIGETGLDPSYVKSIWNISYTSILGETYTTFLFIHRLTLLHGEDEWGQINNKSNNQELFMESITINELPPHQLEKCITIQWPEFNIDKNSYVCN